MVYSFPMKNEERAKLLRLASIASVITAVVLIIVKLGAWYYTNSVGIMASLIDSFMDACASAINFFAIRYALQPPDEEHKFGHGKAEALASLSQAGFICGSVIFLLIQAIEKILNPTTVHNVDIGLSVMLISVVGTAILLSIQRYVMSKTESTAIEADSLHYLSDLLTNVVIIGSLLAANYGMDKFDPLVGILVGIYIFLSAVKIGRNSIDILMDHELVPTDREAIFELVLKNPKVLGVHDLRTRKSGQTTFVQFHLELPDEMALIQAHAVADEVERAFRKTFPNMDVIIHQDPLSMVNKAMIVERRLPHPDDPST